MINIIVIVVAITANIAGEGRCTGTSKYYVA